MNSHLAHRFSFHDKTNRNGTFFQDFEEQYNLRAGNAFFFFEKPNKNLWTHRSLKGNLSQSDFCFYPKRWQNSVRDCQADSSTDPIGGDHRIVVHTLNQACAALNIDRESSSGQVFHLTQNWLLISTTPVHDEYEAEPFEQCLYTKLVEIAKKVG